MSKNCSLKPWTMVMAGVVVLMMPAFLLSPAIPADDGWLKVWLGISLSASKYGLPWVALLFFLLLRMPPRRLLASLLPLLLIIGVGAWVNEYLLKPALAQPRPNIVLLGSSRAGPVLPEGSEAFYALPDKAARSERLAGVLEQTDFVLPPSLREHWVEETGFSFPSGHAFAAASLAGWLSLWVLCARRGYWLLPLFLSWLLAVVYSRVILGVHRPIDVLAGALEGLVLVVLAQWAMQRWFSGAVEEQGVSLSPR